MVSMQGKILLRQGQALIHGPGSSVKPTICDILISDGKIAAIESSIQESVYDDTSLKIIDCHGRIVCPGFISTHNHLYQTPLKGQHGDHTILEYMPCGNLASSLFTLEDGFWGQLSGALESIDAGTTTVVDHSSLNLSPDYQAKTSIRALASSGLRSVYCYCPPRIVSNWAPLEFHDDLTSPWVMDTFTSLASQGPFGNGRVHVGFANDNVYLPHEAITAMYAQLRAGPAKLITSHSVGGPSFQGGPDTPSAADILHAHGLLGRDILISHANFALPGTADLLARTGTSISSTPGTELQMGWPPLAQRPEYHGCASIGVDTHSWASGYLPGQMRLLLQYARTERAVELAKQGKWSRRVGLTVEDVFNLGTVDGARAVGMENEIGKLAVGMRADIIVYGTDSPAMLAAAEENPVAAVVLHSSERDIETVIIDGVIRKENGSLVDVEVSDPIDGGKLLQLGGTKFSWTEIAEKVRGTRKALKDRMRGIDMKAAEEVIIDSFFMNRQTLLESS